VGNQGDYGSQNPRNRDDPAVQLDLQGGLSDASDDDRLAEGEAEGQDLLESPPGLVLEVGDRPGIPRVAFGEEPGAIGRKLTRRGGYGISVRIESRLPHARGQTFDFLDRELVLPDFSHFMPFLGSNPGPVGQESLHESVGSEDAKGVRPALFGQNGPGTLRTSESFCLEARENGHGLLAGDFERPGEAFRAGRSSVSRGMEKLFERIFETNMIRKSSMTQGLVNKTSSGPEQSQCDPGNYGESGQSDKRVGRCRRHAESFFD